LTYPLRNNSIQNEGPIGRGWSARMGLCERCKKSQATFHLTNIDSAGNKSEHHLCEHCALEAGLVSVQKPAVNITEILGSLVAGGKTAASTLSNLVCEKCGISYIEFRNRGLLGCANDYEVFHEPLTKLLMRIQDGASHHLGKAPKSQGAEHKPKQQDLRLLRKRLSEAIKAEDYERAAELRDQIAELDEKP